MLRRRVVTKRRKRSTKRNEFSTAFLLPDLHPWLKEFFTVKNLVPIRDEAWCVLPKWEPLEELRVESEELRVEDEKCAMQNIVNPAVVLETGIASLRPAAFAMTSSVEVSGDTVPQPNVAPIDNSQFSILNSQLLKGTRPSAAPVPFTIPIQAVEDAPTSRHLVRIARRMPDYVPMPAPDFLYHLRSHVGPVRVRMSTIRSSLRTWWDRAIERARMPAPAFNIPAPYNELLVVGLIIGPIEVLWRAIGWRVWSFCDVPTPNALWVELERGLRGRRVERIDHLRPVFKPWAFVPQFSFAAVRQAVFFALTLAIIIIPLKLIGWHPDLQATRGRVLGATASIADTFQTGGSALAKSSFQDAADAFDRARVALIALPDAAGTGGSFGLSIVERIPVVGEKFARANDLRRAAIALAEASSAVARGLAMVANIDLSRADAGAHFDAAIASFTSARQFAERARSQLVRALPALTVDFDHSISIVGRIEHLLPVLRALAGVDRPQRVLLVFQNTNELRPTGGFIGSVARVDVRRGRVTALELPSGGTYDLSGIARANVLPPDPLRLLQPTWQMQDANWFPDFPTTARKLRWFDEQSGGPSVDAVIAVNASVLEDVLTLTGPVTVGGQTFTAASAIAMLTDTVESASARATGKPKQVLAELAPALLERLTGIVRTDAGQGKERLVVLDRFLRALDERDIQLAFTDDATQAAVIAAGWSGEIRSASRDALLVVHTNLGGGKSDARMRESITHEASILADGSVVDTVTITRTHLGSPAPPNAPPSERLAGLANVDYLRVYVPRGSILLSAEGFTPPPESAFERVPIDALPDRDLLAAEANEVIDPTTGVRMTEEFGRTVFGGWAQVPAGAQRSVRFNYRLPWQYEAKKATWFHRSSDPQPYAFLAQKQSGTRATIRHIVRLDPAWRATWTTPNYTNVSSQMWAFEDILTSDRLTGMMIEKSKF